VGFEHRIGRTPGGLKHRDLKTGGYACKGSWQMQAIQPAFNQYVTMPPIVPNAQFFAAAGVSLDNAANKAQTKTIKLMNIRKYIIWGCLVLNWGSPSCID
jgi:hypothetical protein